MLEIANPAGARDACIDRFMALKPLFARGFLTRALPPELQEEVRSVTLHQLEALGHLYPNGLTMGALARALGISDGSAAVLSDRLVKQNLAVRLPDPRDRRVVWLAPSEHARTLIERFRACERERIAARLSALSDAHLAAFVEAMEILAGDCREQADRG